jgi:Bifunctional DNA primase/polymerase, N-terminal/Primase C terminal 2 (PriCT-2)
MVSPDNWYEVVIPAKAVDQDKSYTTYKIGDTTSIINNLRLGAVPVAAAAKAISESVKTVSVAAVKQTKAQTIALASKLPENWSYTPVTRDKKPLTSGWQKKGFSKSAVIEELRNNSKWAGVGALCGTPSGGLLFLDRDGASCDDLIPKLSGVGLDESLPITAIVTSGKPGRCQHIYQIPEEYWDSIHKTVKGTGVIGTDGKDEQLEFRWDGHQSVICGEHPETGAYKWVNPPESTPIAIAPMWMIEQMLKPVGEAKPKPSTVDQSVSSYSDSEVSLESIRRALDAISSDDYATWIKVGQALHSHDLNLFSEWDRWSSRSEKYTNDCAEKWAGFTQGGTINIYWLFKTAKDNGAYAQPVYADLTIQKGDSSSINGGEVPSQMNPTEGGFNEGKTAIAAKALSPQVEIDPEVLALRIASPEHQTADFWFKLSGVLYKSITKPGLAILPNIKNGNVAAYMLISTQFGAIFGPKLTCEMTVGKGIVSQRGGGHALPIGRTGDGKTVITDAVVETLDGVALYAKRQAEIILSIANAMVSFISGATKKSAGAAGSEGENEDKTKLQGELLIAQQFQKNAREGGQSAYFSGGNAIAIAAHSAYCADIYRNSVKFWALYRQYHHKMKDMGAWYRLDEFHNPGLIMYNRDAVAELEKFTGTNFSSAGDAIGLLLAGWSTEDTSSYSRKNLANGGENASNPLTRFSLCALTQEDVRAEFIKKDISIGSSKYGMAPRLNLLHVENTENTRYRVIPKAVGTQARKTTRRGAEDDAKPHVPNAANRVSVSISEALQRIGTTIYNTDIEGVTTLPVPVGDAAAEIYEQFLSWVNDIDPDPNRYCLDRQAKFAQHFTKMCLNAWLVDLVDSSIGKLQSDVDNLFDISFEQGITAEQAFRVIALMKLNYVEHFIDGAKASTLSSIEGEASPEGKVMDMDTLKAIGENKTTLLTWVDSIKDAHVGKPQSKMLEDAINGRVRLALKSITGKTINDWVKLAQSGKEINIKFA